MVRNAVGNDLNGETLSITDRFITSLAVTHDSRKFEGVGDPAAVVLLLQLNRQLHPFIILLSPLGAGLQPGLFSGLA